MSDYNEAKARALIKSILSGVTGIGKVHDYERYANNWNAMVNFYLATGIGETGEEMLRGWNISLADVSQEQESFGSSGNKEVTYHYIIRGFHAVEDASATEKTFVALTLEVLDALDGNSQLHSANREGGSISYFDSEFAEQARFDFRMFGGVLVHYTEIHQRVMEVI